MTKPHGSNPRARRLARNGEAKLAREAKQSARRHRSYYATLSIDELRTSATALQIPVDPDWNRTELLDAIERWVPPKPASEESP